MDDKNKIIDKLNNALLFSKEYEISVEEANELLKYRDLEGKKSKSFLFSIYVSLFIALFVLLAIVVTILDKIGGTTLLLTVMPAFSLLFCISFITNFFIAKRISSKILFPKSSKEKLNALNKKLDEMELGFESQFQLDISLLNPVALDRVLFFVKTGRADSIKEALLLLDQEIEQYHQNSILEETNIRLRQIENREIVKDFFKK